MLSGTPYKQGIARVGDQVLTRLRAAIEADAGPSAGAAALAAPVSAGA